MRVSPGDQRFLASTRGRLVQLLRRAAATVEELARALGLTDNAVRAHLTTLERDGLVRQAGVRRGVSKPASAYALTPQAEQFFPKAYGAILRQFLDVLGERLTPAEVDGLAREVGRRMAAGQGATGDLGQRAQQAVALLNDLGGLAELEERDGGYAICGYSCPLAEAIPGHPEVCRLAETLLAEVIGTPVTECCERGESARCRFVVPGAVS
jgi:predicted ArsR family transcriptional regulator